jgi:thiol-disulfide isomerase/thioredoxin
MKVLIIDFAARRRSRTRCLGKIDGGRIVTTGIVWLALLLSGCQPLGYSADNDLPPEPAAAELAEPLEPAHDFALSTLDGDTVRLSNLRGRWVLINFWATWCAPCRDEMPYLDRLAADHANQLSVLAVNMRESKTTVRAFVEEFDLHLPILVAPDDATLLAYYVRGLPVSVLIDPDGMVTQRIVGPIQPGFVEAEMGNCDAC